MLPLNSDPIPPSPPEAWKPLMWFSHLASRPLERFLHIEAASGIILLVAAALALIWANSPWAQSYTNFWQIPIGVSIGSFSFQRSLEWFINNGLMVIFFFLVGLEIRREIHNGELSEWRRATLPIAAALGGMLVPAGLYLIFAGHSATRSGWGVPMATDIAFAIGVITLLGKRVPAALRVLLLAIAVIDDLGAIIVIALFYSTGISISGIILAAAGLVGIFIMQRIGVRAKTAYIVPSVITWAGIYQAGVHPTIAGVIVGLITPVKAWYGVPGFLLSIKNSFNKIEESLGSKISAHDLSHSLRQVQIASREAISPADSLIESLHSWVAFVIMPLFALANAGVSLSGVTFTPDATRVAFAVSLGLIFGKPMGILLFSWVALRVRIASLPRGITVRHLLVLGVVAGIGFTMALFVGQLAFNSPDLLAAAKLGILIASGIAAVLGIGLGYFLLPKTTLPGAALTADEAASSTEL